MRIAPLVTTVCATLNLRHTVMERNHDEYDENDGLLHSEDEFDFADTRVLITSEYAESTPKPKFLEKLLEWVCLRPSMVAA